MIFFAAPLFLKSGDIEKMGKEKASKKKKITSFRAVILCVLGVFLVASVLNMHAAYSKPLEKTITEPDNKCYFQTTFEHYAMLGNNSLYGAGPFRSNIYFTGLTRWLNGTFEFEFVGDGSSTTSYNCYVLLEPENGYWSKSFPISSGTREGKFKQNFSMNITEYRNLIEIIEKQTNVRENDYKLSVVSEMDVTATREGESIRRRITPTMSFTMNDRLLKVETNSTQVIEKNLFTRERVVPTGADKDRKMSLAFLIVSALALLTGMAVASRPVREVTEEEKNKRKYKPIEGLVEGGVFFVKSLEDLRKIARAEGKPILHDKERREYFVRAEGREYKYCMEEPNEGTKV